VLNSAILRVILATYLAIWTPAMCCCAIKSAMGQAPCHSTEEVRFRSCCALIEKSTRSCCDRELTNDDAPAATDDCCNDLSHGSKCKCHEKSIDRLDTGGKINPSIPTVQLILIDLSPKVLAAAELAHCLLMCRSMSGHTHPPPRSLFSQRCLFLV
jgi:hypothetical protein